MEDVEDVEEVEEVEGRFLQVNLFINNIFKLAPDYIDKHAFTILSSGNQHS